MTVLTILLAIAIQIYMTAKKWSPFISLLVVAVGGGFLLGLNSSEVVQSVEKGAADTLGGLVLIICLGAVLGKLLEETGAAEKVSNCLINAFGPKSIQWAILATGLIIGIPLYYNAGFIILIPLVFMLVRKTGLPLLYLALPMAASLSTTHCFLPPHPGPVVLVQSLGADLGMTLFYGLIIAIPAVILAGPWLGARLRYIKASVPPEFSNTPLKNPLELPSAFTSFLVALLPVLLISLGVIATKYLPDGALKTVLLFTGSPTMALLLSVLIGMAVVGLARKYPVQTITAWTHQSISNIAVILLIITAGGAFKQVLLDSGTAEYIAGFSQKWNMPPLVFAWTITALLRVMIGSATVAGIAASGVVLPLMQVSGSSPELTVLAVGAGSVFGSHVNDSGFWMFKEFLHLSLKQTFLSWTLMESVISVAGLLGVLILDAIL